MSSIKIALAGNPNCGKTTLFNDLTGSSQYVGNWPGVTVEKKEGFLRGDRKTVIQDLPGIYSLSPYTLEEVVTRNYLLDDKPDVILSIWLDGSNLERNLYLTTQLCEVGLRVVVAVNMIDLVEKHGDKIDLNKLSRLLGCQVVATSALRGRGAQEAAAAAKKIAGSSSLPKMIAFDSDIEQVIEAIAEVLPVDLADHHKRWYAIKLFERDEKVQKKLSLTSAQSEIVEGLISGC